MHIAFIPYGERQQVEKFAQSLECQAYQLPLYKGKKKKVQWMFGGIRVTPLGVWEYIIPKEYEQIVLNTLGFQKKPPYKSGVKAYALRKLYNLQKAPEVTTTERFIWRMDYVSIIPIGVRYDSEITYESGNLKGWSHEAI